MPQGMTPQERDAAGQLLRAKIVKMMEAVTERGITVPDRAILDEFLTQREKEATWKMLERERGVRPTSVQECWEGLKKMGGQATKQARVTWLLQFLAGKDWETHLVEAHEEFSNKKEREKVMRPLYKGELEQIHGKAEAKQLIDDGVFKQVPSSVSLAYL